MYNMPTWNGSFKVQIEQVNCFQTRFTFAFFSYRYGYVHPKLIWFIMYDHKSGTTTVKLLDMDCLLRNFSNIILHGLLWEPLEKKLVEGLKENK